MNSWKTYPSCKGSKVITAHHKKSFKGKFCQHIHLLIPEAKEFENPFLDINESLICLDTKDKADRVVCDTNNHLESIKKQKFEEFTTEKLIKQSIDNKLNYFRNSL